MHGFGCRGGRMRSSHAARAAPAGEVFSQGQLSARIDRLKMPLERRTGSTTDHNSADATEPSTDPSSLGHAVLPEIGHDARPWSIYLSPPALFCLQPEKGTLPC